MKRLLVNALLVTLGFAAFASPVAASTPVVRLPTSAADWATFSPAQRQAAYDWIHNDVITSKAKPTIVASSQIVIKSSGIQPMVAVSGQCGISSTNYSWGSEVYGWAEIRTSQAVNWMDTGMQGNIDQLWRNGVKSYTTYGGQGNGSYLYASTTQDHKWWWESVRYSFQTWSSVRLVYLGPWYWYNAYCVVGYTASAAALPIAKRRARATPSESVRARLPFVVRQWRHTLVRRAFHRDNADRGSSWSR